MNKESLRRDCIAKRKQLSTKQRICAQQDLIEKLSCNPVWQKSQHVGLYEAFGSELDMRGCLALAGKLGKCVYFPVVQGENMVFEPQDRSIHAMHDALDCILVPSIAIDERGYRLGYGKGFYDRFLAQGQHGCITIGVAFSCCRVATIFPEKHDIAMDQAIFAQTSM